MTRSMRVAYLSSKEGGPTFLFLYLLTLKGKRTSLLFLLNSWRCNLPRQDFSVDLLGMHYSSDYSGFSDSQLVVAKHSEEESDGVSRRKPVGFIPPTSYIFKKRQITYQRGTMRFSWPDNSLWSEANGIVGSPGASFNGDSHFEGALSEVDALADNDLSNRALIAVRNKLKDVDINLGIAHGERKLTARLIGDTATNIAKSYRSLRRGKWRDALNHLGVSSKKGKPRGNTVPQKWLEMQYGWKPLLSDVYGAADALSQREPGDWRVTAKATVRQDGVFNNSVDAHAMSKCRARLEKSVFARIDALPQNDAIISLASLGVTNPLSVAWELVPFSFVVDWFLPVGNYLSSLDAMFGYGESYLSSSLFVKAEWVDIGETGTYVGFDVVNKFKGTKKVVYLERTASAAVPLPYPPSYKDPRSLGHMANGLALLAQAFGRGR